MRCAMPSIRESPTDEPARHRPIRAAAPGGGGGAGRAPGALAASQKPRCPLWPQAGGPGPKLSHPPPPAPPPRGGGEEHGGAPEPLLQVKDLGVRFGAKQVVRGLNFAIAAGEKLALVG